ncbi:dihydrolipoamide acetyltransferase family protein [Flavobacterium sp. GB2R13]|uniref:dihydrolipoamide acetyltransferase family protein n=1 Tax=Flavobacterium algoris TaxID=3398733 RepID=UPI003A844B12
MIEFLMPSLGADMEDATLIEWKKKPGDTVKRGDIIAEVETQKELIEIEIFEEGIIAELLFKEGAKIPVGTVMALINSNEVTLETKKEEKIPEQESIPLQPIEEKETEPIYVPKVEETPIKETPLYQRSNDDNPIGFQKTTETEPNVAIPKDTVDNTIEKIEADDNRIDTLKTTETEPDVAITKDDVDNTIEKIEADDNRTDTLKTTETETETEPDVAITKDNVDDTIEKIEIENTEILLDESEKQGNTAEGIRTAVAAAMSKSKREIPHYYLEKKINLTNTLAWLQIANEHRVVKNQLLPVALMIKATAKSLLEFPDLNAIWDNGLQLKKDINIGFVVSLRTGGIIVPAIHQVDKKNVDEIMDALNEIIPRARAMRLQSSEWNDSTITITNISDGGADSIFGIIHPPQVAIIGFGNILEQPHAENGMIGICPFVNVTLAGDHRATDGLIGSRFLITLNKHLQNPELL